MAVAKFVLSHCLYWEINENKRDHSQNSWSLSQDFNPGPSRWWVQLFHCKIWYTLLPVQIINPSMIIITWVNSVSFENNPIFRALAIIYYDIDKEGDHVPGKIGYFCLLYVQEIWNIYVWNYILQAMHYTLLHRVALGVLDLMKGQRIFTHVNCKYILCYKESIFRNHVQIFLFRL